jgi:hypothetical protein
MEDIDDQHLDRHYLALAVQRRAFELLAELQERAVDDPRIQVADDIASNVSRSWFGHK